MARLAPSVPLSARIAQELRRRIADGDFPVGSLLPPEVELAHDFGVSRNSVREGIRSLVHTGVLRARAGYGTVVVSTSELAPTLARRIESDSDSEVGEVRLMLEREAARLAAARATEEQRSDLLGALAARADATDGPTYVAADLRFHGALFEASGNALLAELYRGIGGNEQWLRHLNSPDIDFTAYAAQLETVDEAHADIARAITASDPEAAAAAAERMVRLAVTDR